METKKNQGSRPPQSRGQGLERQNPRGPRDGGGPRKKRPKDAQNRRPHPATSGSGRPEGPSSAGSVPQPQDNRGNTSSNSPSTNGPRASGPTRDRFPSQGQNKNRPDQNRNSKSRRFAGEPSHKKSSKDSEGREKKDEEALPATRLKIQKALEVEEKSFRHQVRRYDLLIYDTLPLAHQDLSQIQAKAQEVDQLNVVIRAEANMDDPVLTGIPKVKVFAGAAWTLIHERRVQDGWYQKPQ